MLNVTEHLINIFFRQPPGDDIFLNTELESKKGTFILCQPSGILREGT